MEVATILALAICVCGCAASAVFSALARPSQLRRELDKLHDAVNALEREMLEQDGRNNALLKSVESVHDAVLDDLERAESKRKQAAARMSKVKRSEEQRSNFIGGDDSSPNLDDRANLVALARARGIQITS